MTNTDALLCGQCGAPLPAGASRAEATCAFCGTTSVPKPKVHTIVATIVQVGQRDAGEAGLAFGMQCPRCFDRLQSRRVQETSLRVCERCGGLWVDHATVQRLRSVRDPELEEGVRRLVPLAPFRTDRRPVIACPECKKPMARTPIPNTMETFDTCPDHGTWFDYRELSTAVTAAAEERAGEVTDDDLKAAGVGGSWFSGLFGS